MKCDTCKNHCCIGDYGTLLTLHDAKRISKSTGMPVDEFCYYGPICTDKEGQEELMQDKDHTYFDFSDSGKVLQLKARDDGSCIFLKDKKCSVYHTRPLICRIFPLWYKKVSKRTKLIIDDDVGECWIPAPSMQDTFKNLGYTEQEIKSLVKQFQKEIQEYQKYEKDLETAAPSEVGKKLGIYT